MRSYSPGLSKDLVGSGMHWFRAFERRESQEANRASRRGLFVKSPPTRVASRKALKVSLALNCQMLKALPFCRLPRVGGRQGRVGWRAAVEHSTSRHGLGANPTICHGLSVTSTIRFSPTWTSRLRLVGYPSLQSCINMQRKLSKGLLSGPGRHLEVKNLWKSWESMIRQHPLYPSAEKVEDWSLSKLPANSVRKLKRRYWLVQNVVKKLPSSVRTGRFKVDVSLVYKAILKLRQTLPHRRAIPGMIVKYARRKADDGKGWAWRKRRRRK